MARWTAAIGLMASAVMMTACTSTGTTSPWWQQTGGDACGTPALMRMAGQVMRVGSCGGSFETPAAKVTLHVGQDIDIHMVQEQTRASGNHLVPVWPLPSSSRPSVLARVTISTDKATGTFAARHPGHATLFTTSNCWVVARSQQTHGKCPALDITVLP